MSPIGTPEDGFARLNDPAEWDLALDPRTTPFPTHRARPIVRWSVGIAATVAVAVLALAVGVGIRDLRGGTPPAVAPAPTGGSSQTAEPSPSSTPTSPPSASEPTLSFDGLGPLHLGGPVPADNGIVELETMTCGTQAWRSTSYAGDADFHLFVGTESLLDATSDVSKILLVDDTYTTSWGLGVGATEEALRAALPEATTESGADVTTYTVTNGVNDVVFFVPTAAVYVWTPAEIGHVARIEVVPHGTEVILGAAGQDGIATCD